MNKKQLRAMITIAGEVDPSLQMAVLKANKEMQSLSTGVKGGMSLMWAALKQGSQTFMKTTGALFKNGMSNLGATLKSGFSKAVGLTLKAPIKIATGFIKGIGIASLAALAVTAGAFIQMGASGLSYASDLAEAQNVVDTTFAQSAVVIDDFAARSLEAYGLTSLEAKKYSSTVGAMLKSMGLGAEETLIMSQNLTALSGDMASFHNLSGEEAFEKIRAGLSGETEPLKQLGIVMSVANLEAYALSQGMAQSYASMDQASQATLRYNYLMATTADMQGDFGRTEEGFANQQRMLKANIQQMSGEIMSNAMPALAAAAKEVNGFIGSMDTAEVGAFVGQLAAMAVQFMPLIMELIPTFGGLLTTIMPSLMEIGQAIFPVVVEVVQALAAALEPIVPVVMSFVEAMMPPIMEFFRAVSPLIETLGGLFAAVLAPALQTVSDILTPVFDIFTKLADPINKVIKGLTGLFTGGDSQAAASAMTAAAQDAYTMSTYANGGFSSRPAIFGEAGMEAAIPIKPGNRRSLALLDRTAQLLGVRNTYNSTESDPKIEFTYAPVIQARDSDGNLETMLRRGYAEMRRMIEEFFADRGRLAWE